MSVSDDKLLDLRNSFRSVDADENNGWDLNELTNLLFKMDNLRPMDEINQEATQLMVALDKDKSNTISFVEFFAAQKREDLLPAVRATLDKVVQFLNKPVQERESILAGSNKIQHTEQEQVVENSSGVAEDELTSCKKRIVQLEHDLTSSSKISETLQFEVKELKFNLDVHAKKEASLNTMIKSLQCELELAKAEPLEQPKTFDEEEKLDLRYQLEELREKTNKMQSLISELETAKENGEKRQEALERDLNQSANELQNKQKELENCQQSITKLENKNSELEATVRQQTKDLEKRQQDVKDTQQQLTRDLENKHRELESAVHQQTKELEKREHEAKAYQQRLTDTQDNYGKLLNCVEPLQLEVKALSLERDNLRRTDEEQRLENEDLREQLAKIRRDCDSEIRDLKTKHNQVTRNSVTQRADELKREIRSLKRNDTWFFVIYLALVFAAIGYWYYRTQMREQIL